MWVSFTLLTAGLRGASLFASSLPCTCFISYVVCFASQSSALYSAYLFTSVPFPPFFAHVCLFAGASPRKPWCCSVLFSLRSFRILFAYPFFVRYGNFFLFRVFRLTSFEFARCIRSLPCYLHDFPFSFLSAILRFRIFSLSTVFCLVLFSLSSHFLAYLLVIKYVLPSPRKQCFCVMLFAPFILASAFLFCFIVFESLLFCQLCRAFPFPLSSAIPLTPSFSSLFFFQCFLSACLASRTYVCGVQFEAPFSSFSFCSFLILLFLHLSPLILLLFFVFNRLLCLCFASAFCGTFCFCHNVIFPRTVFSFMHISFRF